MFWEKLRSLFKANRELVFDLIAAVILLIGFYVSWRLTLGEDVDPFFFYSFRFISITFLLGAIFKIVETFPRNKFTNWLYLLIGLPMAIAIFAIDVFRILSVTLIAFGVLLFIQEVVWQILILFLPTYLINLDLKIYLMFVVSLVLLAYWGPKVLFRFSKIMPDSDDPDKAVKHKLKWFLNRINFRRRAYEIGIAVLVFASIENILNLNLFGISIWTSLKGIALEAFITFLAIDRYIINFQSNLVQKNDLNEENT